MNVLHKVESTLQSYQRTSTDFRDGKLRKHSFRLKQS